MNTSYSFLIFFISVSVVNSIIIDTINGKLQGSEATINGKLLYSFKKIPHVEPPVGNLRFAKPVPTKPWNGVIDATKYGPACSQNSTTSSYKPEWIAEDCLYVNVFTSEYCMKNKNCPVVFYIHGGGMLYDSPVMFDDNYLFKNFAANDVVLVLPAFRLGFATFITFETNNVVPANIAFYDIMQALHWVQEDVHSFGGNKKNVTLLGHSMGSSIIYALSFSKVIDPSRKLFQKAIGMSGAVSLMPRSAYTSYTFAFVRKAGCLPSEKFTSVLDMENSIVDCLRKKDWKFLLSVQRELEENGIKCQGIIMDDTLFPAESLNDFVSNPPKISLLTGATSREMDSSYDEHEVIPAAFLSHALGYKHSMQIGNKYDSDVSNGRLNFTHSIETQGMFLSIGQASRELQKTGSDVYLYSYCNRVHPYHVDYLSYLMGVHKFDPDENEAVLAQIIPKLWINFVKTGKPNSDWKPVCNHTLNYYYIDANVESGLLPFNDNFFEENVHSYWLKDIKQFDLLLSGVDIKREVDKNKMKTHIEDRFREAEDKWKSKNHHTRSDPIEMNMNLLENDEANTDRSLTIWHVFILCIFTGIGFLIGSYWSSGKKTKKIYFVQEKPPSYDVSF